MAKTSKKLAHRKKGSPVVMAQLSPAQWDMVVANGAEGALLDIAATGDKEAVKRFLVEIGALEGQPPP